MQEEIKSRLNSGNASYRSVQSLLSSRLLSRNVKVKISSSLAYISYSLTTASFKMIAHSSRPSALFLHLLTPNVFRSSSTQSNHLNLGLPGFLHSPGFPGNTLFTILSSSILTTWPAHSNCLTFMDVTISALLY
jgi:hypothetical protein